MTSNATDKRQAKRRALVVHPELEPIGGGSCVAAWILEALRGDYRTTVLSWKAPELTGVNRYFGTTLTDTDFELRLVPRSLGLIPRALPTPGRLLRTNLLTRAARQLLRRESFDVALNTIEEMDFGCRGIQYVQYPFNYLPRPEHDRWIHHSPWALPLYWRFCRRLGPTTYDGFKRNLTLANSDWTGVQIRRFYGIDSRTVYPPVPGKFQERPWEEREDGFVCVGRFSPEKNLETVVRILAAVRRRHPTIRLHLVGTPHDRATTRWVLDLATNERSWVKVHLDLPRDDLLELMARNRYGIHAMAEEHFGIAVAELQRSSAIVFVPDGGGQVEIVGHDPRLIWGSWREAIEKIDRVLREPDRQTAIRRDVAARKDRFSTQNFMTQIRDVLNNFVSPVAG